MRRRDAVAAVAGAAALGVSVFAVGGALRWTQALVALLVGAGLMAMVRSRRRLGRMSPLVAVLAIAAALTALQLVPLPDAVVEALHPDGAMLRDEGASLMGTSPWRAATMDAPATLQALVAYLTLLGVAVLALRTTVSERGRFAVVAAVGAACALAAVVAGVHKLLGLHDLYGVYEVHHGPHLIGPLLNLNHLGCLMAMGTVVGIGLAAYPRQAGWARSVWLLAAALCGSLAVYTVSRGATLSLVVGSFATVALLIAQRFVSDDVHVGRRRFLTSSLPIAIVATCVLVMIVYSSAGSVGDKFAQTSFDEVNVPTSKFSAWRSATKLIEASPWIGVGRGGFESTFTRVHPASGQLVFAHAENEYLQAIVDWGVPGAIALGLACVWLAVATIRRWREGPLAAAAIGGLVVIAVQSVVDFGAEVLGLAVPATLLAASVAFVPLRESRDHVRRTMGLRIAHVVGLGLGALLLASSLTTTIDEDHQRLRSGDASQTTITEALTRHPLDYYGYAVAAELALRASDPKGIRELNHALRLHPSHGGLHLLAARTLRRGGHDEQAVGEYAAALRFSGVGKKLLGEVTSDLPPSLAANAIPLDAAEVNAVYAMLTDLGRPDVASAWLIRLVNQRPDHARACELLVSRAQGGDTAAFEVLERRCPSSLADAGSLIALGRVFWNAKRYPDVIRLMARVQQAMGNEDAKLDAWSMLCDAYRLELRWDDGKRCLRELGSAAVTKARQQEIASRLELLELERKRSAAP